jgi:hypothetical protein
MLGQPGFFDGDERLLDETVVAPRQASRPYETRLGANTDPPVRHPREGTFCGPKQPAVRHVGRRAWARPRPVLATPACTRAQPSSLTSSYSASLSSDRNRGPDGSNLAFAFDLSACQSWTSRVRKALADPSRAAARSSDTALAKLDLASVRPLPNENHRFPTCMAGDRGHERSSAGLARHLGTMSWGVLVLLGDSVVPATQCTIRIVP